ncbi:MAG TPA: hypothetical protein VMT64_16925 [Candidatus Binataceae bacterium]|nr:hypothetical protein [Candidatus Binataceae bacterium]
MAILLAALFIALPLDALGRVVGGSLVTPADVIAVAIALITPVQLASGRYRIRMKLDNPVMIFAGFTLVGVASIVLSRDASRIVAKGFVQVGGISIMLLTCVALANEVSRRPVLFAALVRLCAMMLAIVAAIGIAQFICANVFGHSEFLNFAFLNRWSGGNVWYNRGALDGIVRANSIMQEPSALGMVLGAVAGVALLRLGTRGGNYRAAVARMIPAPIAFAILAGFVVTVSLIDLVLLATIAISLWIVSRQIGVGAVLGLSVGGVLIGGASYIAIASTLPEMSAKLSAMDAVTSGDIQVKRAEDLSAIALAVNVAVMRANLARDPILGAGLGAHPVAYDRENPGLGRLPADIVSIGMNKEDAASLLVRLLSESGILGAAVFLTGWILAVMRARRYILARIDSAGGVDAFSALAVGVTASMVGVGIACIARAPQYYAPWFWLPMALTAAVPQLLMSVEREAHRTRNA